MVAKNKLTIIGIINGVDCPIDMAKPRTVVDLRERICKATNNTGRPFTEWEVHDTGKRLKLSTKIGTLEDGARLFFNLKVGAGGICLWGSKTVLRKDSIITSGFTAFNEAMKNWGTNKLLYDKHYL